MIFRLLIIVVLVVAGAVGIVFLLGSVLPVGHVAARSAVVVGAPDRVFRLVTDVERHPTWRRDVTSVALLPPVDGRPRYIERSGSDAMTFEVVESRPSDRFATRIVGEELPFGGTWVVEVVPVEAGSRVTITERGEVYSPLFRFVSRYLMGHTRTIDAYLGSLIDHLGGDDIIGPATPADAPAA